MNKAWVKPHFPRSTDHSFVLCDMAQMNWLHVFSCASFVRPCKNAAVISHMHVPFGNQPGIDSCMIHRVWNQSHYLFFVKQVIRADLLENTLAIISSHIHATQSVMCNMQKSRLNRTFSLGNFTRYKPTWTRHTPWLCHMNYIAQTMATVFTSHSRATATPDIFYFLFLPNRHEEWKYKLKLYVWFISEKFWKISCKKFWNYFRKIFGNPQSKLRNTYFEKIN